MGVANTQKTLKIQQKNGALNQDSKALEKYSNIEDCPLPQEDFKEWIKFQKQNWRKIRSNFKTHNKIIHREAPQNMTTQSLAGFFKTSDDLILNSNWHVVSMESTLDPGILKVWVSTQSAQMFSIKLRVPRLIFLNTKTETENSKDFKLLKTKEMLTTHKQGITKLIQKELNVNKKNNLKKIVNYSRKKKIA